MREPRTTAWLGPPAPVPARAGGPPAPASVRAGEPGAARVRSPVSRGLAERSTQRASQLQPAAARGAAHRPSGPSGAIAEFPSLERCAAYIAARAALTAVRDAAAAWPPEVADHARQAALDALALVAEAVAYDHGTAGRRHCLRGAISAALDVAAMADVAAAIGCASDELSEVQRLAGRTVALLGMFLHATTGGI